MAFIEKAKVIKPKNGELITLYKGMSCTNGSIAINDSNHDMIIEINGHITEPLGPGKHPLNTGYSPFFTRIRNYMTGGIAPVVVNVYYVSKQNFSTNWSTGEFWCREDVLNIPFPVRLAAAGTMIYRISDSRQFISNLVGLRTFNDSDLSSSTKTLIIPKIKDSILSRLSSSNFMNAQQNLTGLSSELLPCIRRNFTPFGISLTALEILSFNPHPDDFAKIQTFHEKRIENATEIEAKANEIASIYNGNVFDKAKLESLVNLSKNQGNGGFISQLGMFPMMLNMGRQMSEQMGDMFSDNRVPHPSNNRCPHCQETYSGTARYCPHCGHQL